ncbi:DNA double-strand break repair nuclease NurA [Acidianus brierleyi]|uniref:Nuclease NurA n=1 Tax=Acidianus brierleyi TaxID=41673 RepID=A0A2U9IH22_9CREN|nr:DNA double-strand break repair nuclease NurA [Acidianus brierleyi]AWR95352.1 nuclease NurA [Acidianus brierleyi]
MEIEDAILSLMKLLSEISIDQPYLGTSISVDSSESTPIYYEEEIGKCSPFSDFGYLDSSSRIINVKGANIYIASLYANDSGRHVLIPLDASFPFLAIKANGTVIQKVKSTMSVVRTENVNGVAYTPDYKDDNILDELRISLENYAINNSNSDVMIVDGPIFPGPYIQMVGEPYKSAFEKLTLERKTDKIVGIVKRLNFTRKLSREEEISKKYPDLVKSGVTDDVLVFEMGKGKDPYVTPIYKEEIEIGGKKFVRFMSYVKVRDSVFRVESKDKELLCRGVETALLNSSIRGIPTFIEVADKISRKLSASTFLLSFVYAKSLIGVNYDDWNRYKEATQDLGD